MDDVVSESLARQRFRDAVGTFAVLARCSRPSDLWRARAIVGSAAERSRSPRARRSVRAAS